MVPLKEIREKAKELRISNYSRMRKDELIRAIQKSEGNDECFKTFQGCGQQDCLWMSDCQN